MIHVAIIGTGSIAEVHIEGLIRFNNRCKIVALCNRTLQKAEDVKKKYNLDCFVFDDDRKMYQAGLVIDLVIICTPTFTHGKLAISAMKEGKHVLLEKPMAASLEECDAILKAQKENKVIFSCVFQNRFRNPIYKLKKTLDSGLAGKLLFSQINSLWWRGHSYYDLWWRGTWEKEGGGCTLNHAVHHIDLLNYLTGCLPSEVIAMLANVNHDNSEVEDLSIAALKYKNGSMAEITSSVIHHGGEQSIILQCERAKLSEPFNVKAEVSKTDGFPLEGGNKELIRQLEEFYAKVPDLEYEGHIGQIDDMLTAIETNGMPMITGEDGRAATELITAIYKAGTTKQQVSLPIAPKDEFYTFNGLCKNVKMN